MLVFITAMRHPYNANNYKRLELLLEMALRSVCAQTDPSLRVIVVCHCKPRIEYTDPRIIYHVIDFPPPCAEKMPVTDLQIGYRDKGTKILSGVLLARKLGARHVAYFDADDLVSKHVVRFVNANADTAGWYVDSGYVLDYANWRVQRKHGLIRYCGTTVITKIADLLKVSNIDKDIDESSTQDELLAKVPLNIIKYIYGDHRSMTSLFASCGLHMLPFPFRAAVWVLRTGENFTVNKRIFRGLPITPEFRDEFGLAVAPSTDRASIADRVSEKLSTLRSRLGSLCFRIQGFPRLPNS